jgi:hypothetical protein
MATFELSKTYNLDIKTTLISVLGSSYKLMKVKGILTADQAVKFSDIATMHEQLRTLDTSLPTSVANLTYILFEKVDGEQVVYPDIYFTKAAQVDAVNLKVEIAGCSTTDWVIVESALKELGYSNITISTYE